MGSTEQTRVREYILNQLTALGLNAEVQASGKSVRNIVAILRGTGNGDSILLVSHYDTVAVSPGASDDGSAVAAILETLRSLKASTPLKNDVMALFSDGEEMGLLGAKAFVSGHPWAKDVRLVLNFEARGTKGPTFMFETSEGNAWLIREYSKSSSFPFANSLMSGIYKMLSNNTDFTIFKETGYRGLNFAYIDGFSNYHTRFDNIENVDQRSLQHQGANALSLARHFGDLDLGDTSTTDAVYFDILSLFIVWYPTQWVAPLTVLLIMMVVGVLVLGIRRKKLSARGASLGFFALFACMISAAFAAELAESIISAIFRPSAPETLSSRYTLGLVCFAVAVSSALYAWLCRNLSLFDGVVGALLWWVLLLATTAVLMPSGSYLFTWPPFFTLAGLLFRLTRGEHELSAKKSLLLLFAAALPAIILFVPVICMMFIALTLSWAGAIMIMVVLPLGLLVPQFKSLALGNRAVAELDEPSLRNASIAGSLG